MTVTVESHLMDEFSSAVTRFAAAANGRYRVPVESLIDLNRALGSIDGLDTDKLREAAHIAARGGAGASAEGDVAPVSSVVEQGVGIADGFFSRFFQREKDSYDRERERATELDEQMRQCCDAVDSVADDSGTAIREIFLAAVPVLQVLTLLLGRSPWGVVASAAISAGSYLVERTTNTAQETCRDRDEAINQCLEMYLECCENYCAEQEDAPPKEAPEVKEPEAHEPAEPEETEPAGPTEPAEPEPAEPAGEDPSDKSRDPKEPPAPVAQPSTPAPSPTAVQPMEPVKQVEPADTTVPSTRTEDGVEKRVNAGKVATQPAAQEPLSAPEPAPAPELEPMPTPEPEPEPEPAKPTEHATGSAEAQGQINLNVIVVDAATAASVAAENTFGAGAGATAVESMAAEVETQVRQAVESVPTEAYLGVLGLVGAGLAAVSWEACVCCLEAAAAECEAVAEAPAPAPEAEVVPAAAPEPTPPPKPEVQPDVQPDATPPPPELGDVEEPTPPPKKDGSTPAAPASSEPPEPTEPPEPDHPGPVTTETATAQEPAEPAPDNDDHQTEENPVDPLGEQRTRKAGTW